jgi:ankyrin repeat protein
MTTLKHYAGASVNSCLADNGRGVTLLSAAARDGKTDIAKLFIEYGV